MSPIIPSRYGHPKYNVFPQKSRATSLGGFKASSQRGTPGSDSKSRRRQRVEESKVTVQPTEDDDGDNFYSKQLAAARFQRNHRLINVLFSDICVDLEQPSDNDKLQACKKRVKSLTDYQKKIDDEITELTEKFNHKKAKIADDGKKFADKLNEFITNSKKELEILRAEQEVRRQKELAEKALRQQMKQDSQETTPTKAPEQVAMEVETTPTHSTQKQPIEFNDSDIGSVLDQIVDSVAKAV